MLASLCAALLVIFISIRFRIFTKASKDVGNIPGLWSLFAPVSLVGAIVPTMYLNPGLHWTWRWRSFAYRQLGSDTISVVPLVMGFTSIYTCSIEVAKQVLSGKPQFWKAPDSLPNFLLWGDNVISANYDNYKRHRKIVAPGFTTKTYDLVWAESVKTYREMMDAEGWASQESFSLSSVNPLMFKITLTIIGRCGFGLPFPWQRSHDIHQDHRISFDKALFIVCRYVIARLVTPKWMYKLPIKFLRDLDEANRVLSQSMKSFVSHKKAEINSEASTADITNKTDLFTCLVRANEQESKVGLSDQELIGNIFAFMFAGHETTAQVLSATLGLLALYPEQQDIAVEQINSVLSDNREPVIDDMPNLGKVLACFQEAARMFPPGSLLTRDTTDAVVLSLDQPDGTHKLITLAPGVRIKIDLVGVGYNPRVFDNPEEFRPSRWYNKTEADLVFFGFGPRACLGRKFASVEAVCLLTMILRDWKVEPIFINDKETPEMWRTRALRAQIAGQAFGVQSVPLIFKRRNKVC